MTGKGSVPNDRTPSDEVLRKDVFAWFGGAAYSAQLFEVELGTLIICLFHFLLKDTTVNWENCFNVVDEHVSKLNLERLFKELKNLKFNLSEDIEKKFENYKNKRNYLMHRFFYSNSTKLEIKKGCEEMIVELQELNELFQEADFTTQALSRLVRKASGISEEKLQNYIDEETKKT